MRQVGAAAASTRPIDAQAAAIDAALDFHRDVLDDPLMVAAALVGRELAAIASAAILPLARLAPDILHHCHA